MKVQGSAFFFGYEADAVEASIGSYFDSLVNQPAKTEWPLHRPYVPGFAYRRRLFLNDLADCWGGVIISARATDFHHYVKQVGNTVKVVAQKTGPNAPVEVNFFCIRKDSGKGIYSNYHGSYAFGAFLADLWASYRSMVDAYKSVALNALAKDADKDEIASAKKPYSLRGKAEYSPLFNPKSFERLVKDLQEVEEVRLTTYSIDSPSDRPVGTRINNVHKVYRLVDGQTRLDQKLLNWIFKKKQGATRALKGGGSSFSGSVRGLLPSGEERTVPFGSAIDDQLNFEYDDIGSFDTRNLAANPCLAAMLSKLRSGVMFDP